MTVERLCELWRILEMRDGCVYKTEFVEEVWTSEKVAPQGFTYVSLSTERDMELCKAGIRTMRVKEK